VALWKARLDVSAVGVDDDFFELGGDSMLALQVAAAAERTFGVRVSVRSMIKYPTIRRLAEALARHSADGARTVEGEGR
jgi:acyl carrier protein